MSLLRHRSFQVFASLVLYFVLAPHLPEEVHRGLYTASVAIKDLLLWMLPATIAFFIAYAISSFEKKAPLFILTLLLFEAVSNALSVWYSYAAGHIAIHSVISIAPERLTDAFAPLWRLPMVRPTWWSADKGSLVGVLLGLAAVFGAASLKEWIRRGKEGAEKILTRFFAKLIPLFVLGFVARMHQTHLLEQLASRYAIFLVWLVSILGAYLCLLFIAGAGRRWLRAMKNLLPAAGISFSSGCSLSTMPWTIEGAGKNLADPDLAKSVIPATTNIQQIGDCIANAFLCFLIYVQFYGHAPGLATWGLFSVSFVLARFATAAVIGGAIFIMLPVYEQYLGFNAEMIAIILAFNVLLDPVITCSNVVANGALCRVFERIWGCLYVVQKPMIERR